MSLSLTLKIFQLSLSSFSLDDLYLHVFARWNVNI